MTTRSAKRPFLLVLSLLLGLAQSGFGQDWEKVRMAATRLAGGITMLRGAGGNIGVCAGPEGILLVDSQFAELHDKIVAELKAIAPGPVRFLLNTNWHYDHVSGNELFGRSGALIVAHEQSRVRMGSEQTFLGFAAKNPAFPAAALPALTVRDSFTLHFNGETVEARHIANAHSDADLLFHFKQADVIHCGDLLFSHMYPFIDVANGGSIDGSIAAASQILEMCGPATRLIPGHGPAMTRDDVVAYRDMLVRVRDRVAALLKTGKSAEEIVAARPTADLDPFWGRGADLFVQLVCRSLMNR